MMDSEPKAHVSFSFGGEMDPVEALKVMTKAKERGLEKEHYGMLPEQPSTKSRRRSRSKSSRKR
jgi:hypothetical protein